MSPTGSKLNGTWHGYLSYKAEPKVAFIAELREREGFITGTAVEPFRSYRSTIHGRRHGTRIDFEKRYTTSQVAHYSGELSTDGLWITGRWTIEGKNGPFEMYRHEG